VLQLRVSCAQDRPYHQGLPSTRYMACADVISCVRLRRR
jgi:hypothetical protein